jgi:glycosyltransferase involved in cell wall biosynthesis
MSLLALRPGQVGGAETYVRALVEWIPQVASRDELLLLLDRDLDRGLAAPGWRKVVVPLSSGAVVAQRILEAYSPWRAAGLERLVGALAADVLFFPQQSIFPARVNTPVVLTAVDVQYLFHPEHFGLFDRTFRPRVYPRSLATAHHVVAISEFTKRTLVEACGVASEKVTAIPLGFTPRDISQVEPYRDGLSYLYYPAATYPHKAHDTLLRSLAVLRRRGELRHLLILTGERTTHWKVLDRLVRDLGMTDVVQHLGFVSSGLVDSLYAGADAVVFPSRYEGFGLPVIEAVQFGKRIVTSRLPVFGELGVPEEAQIDFEHPEALAVALGRQGPTVLGRDQVTWRETAERTVETLRRAAGR